MMHREGNDFIIDFATRTKINYENTCQEYKVTQLINSAIGLLIIPKEKGKFIIVDKMLPKELLGKLQQGIEENTYKNGKNLNQIVRHIRNGIAHGGVKLIGSQPSDQTQPPAIEKIEIKDHCDEDKTKCIPAQDFRIVLTVELLEEFFYAFSDAIVSKINSIKEK